MSQAESNNSLKRGGVLPKYPLRAKKGSIALPFPFFALIYIKNPTNGDTSYPSIY